MVEAMYQLPWESTVYRNRHGRGTRTPMFGTRLPRYRTRSGMFDDMLVAQIRRLNDAWPELVAPVQFAVEDVPPSTRHHGRPLRTWLAVFPRGTWHSAARRAVPYAFAIACAKPYGPAIRHPRRSGVAPGGTVWTPSRRDRPRLGYVINARRSCSGWPVPARGLLQIRCADNRHSGQFRIRYVFLADTDVPHH